MVRDPCPIRRRITLELSVERQLAHDRGQVTFEATPVRRARNEEKQTEYDKNVEYQVRAAPDADKLGQAG